MENSYDEEGKSADVDIVFANEDEAKTFACEAAHQNDLNCVLYWRIGIPVEPI